MWWIDSGHMLKDDMLKILSDDEGPQVFMINVVSKG
jgi:hypothetical protein